MTATREIIRHVLDIDAMVLAELAAKKRDQKIAKFLRRYRPKRKRS